MLDLTIRSCSPSSSSAPMAAPYPTALTMVVLQVTGQAWSVAYFLWIPMVYDLDTARDFYRDQGFDITETLISRE